MHILIGSQKWFTEAELNIISQQTLRLSDPVLEAGSPSEPVLIPFFSQSWSSLLNNIKISLCLSSISKFWHYVRIGKWVELSYTHAWMTTSLKQISSDVFQRVLSGLKSREGPVHSQNKLFLKLPLKNYWRGEMFYSNPEETEKSEVYSVSGLD